MEPIHIKALSDLGQTAELTEDDFYACYSCDGLRWLWRVGRAMRFVRERLMRDAGAGKRMIRAIIHE